MLLFFKNYIKDTFLHPQPTVGDKPRIEFVDLAKGVCILLVIAWHCSAFADEIPNVSRLIRMPLYFVISGLFYKDYGGWLLTIVKKVNRLIIPFVFFFLLSYAFLAIGRRLGLIEHSDSDITDLFYHRDIYNVALWFLLCLFNINVIFTLLRLLSVNEIYLAVVSIACGGVGYWLSVSGLYLPFYVDTALTAMPMFYFGHLLSRTKLLYPSRLDWWGMLCGALILVVVYIVYNSLECRAFVYYHNRLECNFLVADLLSIAGVFGLLMVLKPIKWLPVVSMIGRYSIVALCLHNMLLALINGFLKPISCEMAFVLTVVACWVVTPLFVKLLPWFTAQKDLITLPRKK
jgi:fucose 4-O-acetylase-like acetyltransferase